MFTNLSEWYYPRTVDEALSLLKKGEVVPHAGGTGLLRIRSNRIRGLVDLRRLPLSYLREDDQFFHIGAGVTLAQIVAWKRLKGAAVIVKQAASMAASTPLRNRITIGGSIAVPLPWSDVPPVLLALDAQIEVKGTAKGTYSADQFFQQNPLDGTSLVTEIKIPKLDGKAIFKRVTQTKFDYSMLDLALYALINDKQFKEIRVAVGCIIPRALHLTNVEDFLRDKQPTEEALNRAIQLVDIRPSADKRASKEYRQQLLKILLKRGLTEVL